MQSVSRKLAYIAALCSFGVSHSVQAQTALEMDRNALAKSFGLSPDEGLLVQGGSGCAVLHPKVALAGETIKVMPNGTKINCNQGLADGIDNCGDRFDMGIPIASSRGARMPEVYPAGCWKAFTPGYKSPVQFLYQWWNSDISVVIVSDTQGVENFLDFSKLNNSGPEDKKLASVSIYTKDNKYLYFAADKFNCEKSINPSSEIYAKSGRQGEYLKKASELCKNFDWGEGGSEVYRVLEQTSILKNGAHENVSTRFHICAIIGKVEAAAKKAGFGNECPAVWQQLAQPYLPQIDAAMRESHARDAQRDARVAELRQGFSARYAANVQAAAQNERALVRAETERLIAVGQNRVASFKAANPAIFQGKVAPAKPFVKPGDPADSAVLIIGDNGRGPMSLSVSTSVLNESGAGALYQLPGNSDQTAIDSVAAQARSAGAKTLYIVYMDRAFAWEGPVAVKPAKIFYAYKKPPEANPNYDLWVRELKAARAALAEEQGSFDRTYSTAQNGGYGDGAKGAFTGILMTLGSSSDLSKAENRVANAEKQLASMSKTIQDTELVSKDGISTDYRFVFNAQLAVYACDLAASYCAEKERPVSEAVTTTRYPYYFPQDTQDTYGFYEREAQKNLYTKADQKRAFGLTVDGIGTFVDGAPYQIPLTGLSRYIKFADNETKKHFKASMANNEASFSAIAPQLVAAGDAMSAYNFVDVAGMIAAARKRVVQTELQGL